MSRCMGIWQFPGLYGTKVGGKQTANSANSRILYEELINNFEPGNKVDCLLISVQMMPKSYGISTQTFPFVYGQL